MQAGAASSIVAIHVFVSGRLAKNAALAARLITVSM
jgi:hypothetical protein